MGLTGDESISENFVEPFNDNSVSKSDRGADFFAKILRDDGMALARLSNEFRTFFLMVRPQNDSMLSYFEREDAIRQIFALFADKKY